MSEEITIRPWDIFRKNVDKISNEMLQKRLSICAVCPEYIRLTSQCKACGCFMKGKASIADASCPKGKWGRLVVSYKEEGEVND